MDSPASDEREIIMMKKIHIAPPKTFWQKYGGYLMIGFALVIQVGSFLFAYQSSRELVDVHHEYDAECLSINLLYSLPYPILSILAVI